MTAAQVVDQTSITHVWHALGGGELRRGRGQAWWRRRADGWSVSLSDERGAWYDHRDGIGGGLLDLIQHIRGGSRGEALRWLADWRGIPLDSAPLSQTDRRRYAQARQNAPELAWSAEMWWRERRAKLEERKAEALACEDFAALATAAREHYRLSKLKLEPEAAIREYLRARQQNPDDTAALVRAGERWAEASEAALTLVIARWAREAEQEASGVAA